MIKKLQLEPFTPLELDDILVKHYQKTEDCPFRFSTLPSSVNLDVLWGSTKIINTRKVEDIYLTSDNMQAEELKLLASPQVDKNIFLSHSFKDSAEAIALARKLTDHKLYPWLAETEILRHEHINESVKNAIEELPLTGVFITEHLLRSVWSAKEIDFTFKNEKKMIGFVDMSDSKLLAKIRDGNFKGGNKLSREIFRRFFDNHTDVKFLPYKDPNKRFKEYFKGSENIIDWEQMQYSI